MKNLRDIIIVIIEKVSKRPRQKHNVHARKHGLPSRILFVEGYHFYTITP